MSKLNLLLFLFVFPFLLQPNKFSSTIDRTEEAKKNAAHKCVEENISSGQVVGVGR